MIIDKQRQTKQKIGTTKKIKMLGKLSQDSNESIHYQILILILPLIKTTTTLYIKQTITCKNYISLPPWWLVTTLVWKLYEEDNAFFQFVIAPLPYCKGEMYKSQESYTSVMSFSQMLSINHRTDYISTVST